MTSKRRFERLFARNREHGEGVIMPFLVLGDPGIDESVRLASLLIAYGADALELGLPVNHPHKDGAVIRRAHQRARQAGVTPASCLKAIERIRRRHPEVPVCVLLYTGILQESDKSFVKELAQAGADAALIADPSTNDLHVDLRLQESGLPRIGFVQPHELGKRMRPAYPNQPFLYLASRTGPTGLQNAFRPPLPSLIETVGRHAPSPVLVGFGLRNSHDARAVMRSGANGVVCGSAIIQLHEKTLRDPGEKHRCMARFLGEMKEAMRLSDDARSLEQKKLPLSPQRNY